MKCHFINVRGVGKILIPGCMGSLNRETLDWCYCYGGHHSKRKEQADKEVYIMELKLQIKKLKTLCKKLQK